jgi:hypothetical protein
VHPTTPGGQNEGEKASTDAKFEERETGGDEYGG